MIPVRQGVDEEPGKIIWNASALSVETIPDKLIGRTEQAAALRTGLRPMTGGDRPVSSWLYGPPGSGKTLVARSVAGELCPSGSSRTAVYVNCWQHRTLYSVLQAIVDELRILMAEAQDTDVKFDRIRQRMRGRPMVVILDDIDRPMPAQREEILCGLLNLPRAGLICTAQSMRALAALDERARSRLGPVITQFPPYSVEQVEEILTDRAHRGLVPGSWTASVIKHIASASGGDARMGIQILRQATAAAEEAGSGRLELRFIKPLLRQWQDVRQEARTAALSEHERIIRQLAARYGPLGTTELRRRYENHCHSHGLDPVARRTFTKYLGHLAAAGLLNVSDRPMATGGRLVRVAEVHASTAAMS